MKIIQEYSHLGGSEILNRKYPEIENEINEIISEVFSYRNKICKEDNSNKGKLIYAPGKINESFKEAFKKKEFAKHRINFKTPLISGEEINGWKEVDFTKDKVFVEVQLGKYFSMFYDMAKFQYFFNNGQLDVGIEIVPCHDLYKEMSSGVAYGEQLINDIERLNRTFPVVPVKIILIDCESRNYNFSQIKELKGREIVWKSEYL